MKNHIILCCLENYEFLLYVEMLSVSSEYVQV
jgi:hypothetical protein